MPRKIPSSNYIFAVGRIRALERFLITQEVFEEAIELDVSGALRLFVESDLYSDELLHVKDSRQLENILSQELLKIKQLISGLILDKALLGLLESDTLQCVEGIIKLYPSEFLQDYLTHLIDMHNIKSFLRLYILKEPPQRLNEALICEGFIKREDFLKVYTQDLAAFLNRLEYARKHYHMFDYAYSLGEAIQKTVKENSFVALEKAINDFLAQILKSAKYLNFGPEILLAYYFAKVNEINLIRMIILAKLNNVPSDLVKERLNSVYA